MTSPRIRPRPALTAIALGLGAVLALGGCSNPLQDAVDSFTEDGVKQALEGVVEEATGGAIQGLGSSEIPDDFPTEVPTPGGDPVHAMRIDGGDDGVMWTLLYVAENEGEFQKLADKIKANGFTEQSNSELGEGLSGATYTNGKYFVMLNAVKDDDGTALQLGVKEQTAE